MAEIFVNSQSLIRFAGDLKNPKRTLRKIGALLVAQGQRAFKEQRFGAIKWPERYKGAPTPYINKASVLRRAEAGKPPLPRDTQNRTPALVATGKLRKSLAGKASVREVGQYAVQYGTTEKYAPQHQFGAIITTSVSDNAKKTLKKWLKQKDNRKYWPRFAKLLKKGGAKTVQARIWPRPFIGITPALRGKVSIVVAEDLASGGRTATE